MTSLHQRYRPECFEDVFGNEAVIARLKAALNNTKFRPHTYGLHGPAGCGKITLGRIIATELGCQGMDFVELDSADFRGIDTVRYIRQHINYAPGESACRVWLLDEVHQMTNDAQNALLKALEEPPEHVYFVLCTTAPEKLLPTIRSRCTEYTVSPLTNSEMRCLLRRVTKAEGMSLPTAVYQKIAQRNRAPRDALIALEQVLSMPEDERLEMADLVGKKDKRFPLFT